MRRVLLKAGQVFQGPLLLVNQAHPLQDKTRPALLAPDKRAPHILLEARAARLLSACIQALGAAAAISPVSGWRSLEEQQQIWDQSMAENGADFTRRFVALPGCSEHQSGLAIDLGRRGGDLDFIRPAFPYSGIFGRFRRLALDYGFIQRYEKGKEEVTGIAAEPWHFRYVGAPHARLMAEAGLCLEEYMDQLRTGPRSCRLPDGRHVRISFIPCQGRETEVKLPEGCCQISGNNADGFILTDWGQSA